MQLHDVYLGLGGNIGNSENTLQSALKHLSQISAVKDLKVSSLYKTPALSDFPQPIYTNAVCQFMTSFAPNELLQEIQGIELVHGKLPKPKNAPRILDIDILFFGKECFSDPHLEIPHPRWFERLFVLIPLSELTSFISYLTSDQKRLQFFNLEEMIQSFPQSEQDEIYCSKKTFTF